MRNHKKIYISIVVLFLLIAVIFFTQTGLKQNTKQNKQGVRCGSEWTKIFEGNTTGKSIPSDLGDQGVEFDIIQSLSYTELNRFIENGCNFQIVRDISLGGGSLTESFTCQNIILSTNGGFACLSNKYSFNGTEEDTIYKGVKLQFGFDKPEELSGFESNGKLYYIPYGKWDYPSGNLKIFSRG